MFRAQDAFLRPFLLAALFIASGIPVLAQTNYYWGGQGANNTLTTDNNWFNALTAGTSVIPANADTTRLQFGTRTATLTTVNNPTSGFNTSGITFNSGAFDLYSFTISGSGFEFKKFNSTNPTITQNSFQNHTISTPIVLAESLTLLGTGTGIVTLSGAWTGGTKGLAKSDGSWFNITQNASSVGTTTINGGVLQLSSTGALGTTTVNTGGVLLNTGSGALGVIQLRGGTYMQSGTFSRALGTGATNINFGTGGGGFAAFGGALSVTTSLGTWAGTNSIPSASALVLGSSIANNVVTLSQALNLGAAVRTIQLADNSNSADDWSIFAGVLSNGGLTVTGQGRLILSGTNTYTGVTSINGVTVSVGTIGNGGVAGNLGQATNTATNLVLGGGVLQYTGATASTNRNFTLTTATSSTIEVTQAGTALTMTGANTTTTGALTKAGAGSLILSANQLSTGGFTLAAGTLRATTNAGALGAGGLTLSGGELQLANNTALTFGRNTTVSGNTTIVSDRLAAGAAVTHTLGTLSLGAQTLTIGAGANVSSGTAAIAFGDTTFTGAGTILANAGSQATFNGTIGGDFTKTFAGTGNVLASGVISGSGALIKNGAGTLTLSAVNSYTGGTTLNSGILSIGATATPGSGAITFNGGALLVTATRSLANDITVNSLTAGVSIGDGLTLTLTGVISGSSLFKEGNGALEIAGSFSQSTPLAVSTGQVQLSGNVAVIGDVDLSGSSAILNIGNVTSPTVTFDSLTGVVGSKIQLNAKTLEVGLDDSSTLFAGIIEGTQASSLVKLGDGTLTLSGANTFTGATSVNAGTIAVDGSLANTSTTVGSGGTLQGSGSITGSVTVQSGGTLATGNSIESLTTGALSLQAGSTFAYEINNDALAGVAGDLTAVTGNLTFDLTNAAILTISELGSGSWTIGEKLTLISYSGAWNDGLFSYNSSTLADDSTINFSSMDWLFNYNDTAAGTNYTGDLTSGSYVTMTAIAPIPEPNVAALGVIGMFLLLRRRR